MRLVSVLIPLVVFGLPSCARAHVIPNDAKIQAFLRPNGQRLRLVVRVPLEAMVDIAYPTRGSSGEFLDLDRADYALRELASLWIADNIEVYEGDRQLSHPPIVDVRASLPFDGSFVSYERALAHVTGPRLTNNVDLVWNQGLLDVLLDYPIQSAESRFSIHSKLSTLALRTTTSLGYLGSDGPVRAFEFVGDPGLIDLDPSWGQAAVRFIKTGVLEILGGADYWLFLFVLAIPLRRLGALVPVAVSFAVAEGITLSPASGFAPDSLWFQPLLGLLIAISIVYMAIENGVGAGTKRRWMMAFGFGLVLGFRFSFALQQTLQFAGAHPLASLVSFGAGVAVGQMLLLTLFLPALLLLFRLVTDRVGTFVLSLMTGDIAWHWALDRLTLLKQYQFQWPSITPALMLTAVGWIMDLLIAAAVFWLLLTTIRRYRSGNRASEGAIAEAKR